MGAHNHQTVHYVMKVTMKELEATTSHSISLRTSGYNGMIYSVTLSLSLYTLSMYKIITTTTITVFSLVVFIQI